MLELHNVTVDSGVGPLSVTVGDGRIARILGPQGAGKTALLRALLGLIPVTAGHISIDGELLTPQSAPYFRRQMAYVPQRLTPLYGQLLWGGLQHLRRDEIEQPSVLYLAMLRCAAEAARPLVLVDEPTDQIDLVTADAAQQLIQLMLRRGSTVVMTRRQSGSGISIETERI